MIIDLHFHTEKYSECSRIELEDGIRRAREIGLDGICLTEHDVFAEYGNIPYLEKQYGVKIFIGVEILTREGDILCFGLDRIPSVTVSSGELISYLYKTGGASIAAHPFRDNNRGVRDLFIRLPNLTAVEAYNGNTGKEDNKKALELASAYDIKTTGGSDAHCPEKIGIFATSFPGKIRSIQELAASLRNGDFHPVIYDIDRYRNIRGSL